MAEQQNEPFTAERLTEKVAEVLAFWPLYSVFSYKGKDGHLQKLGGFEGRTVYRYARLPERLAMWCAKCRQLTQWSTNDREVYFGRGPFYEGRYICRNCGERQVTYFFLWKEVDGGGVLFKVGQYPALSHEPPKELAKAFDELDAAYYTKALDCRNFNYGLGAVTYLRRIVENRINNLLDLLAEVAQQEGKDGDVVAKLREARTSSRAEDRLEIAYTLLPDRLKAGGHNPLSYIYDITSDAIHRKSEEECIDAFDKARGAFEYLFIQLRHEKTTRDKYAASLKSLEEKAKKIQARREVVGRKEDLSTDTGISKT